MSFPTDELDVLVELQLAGAWTDVTEHVYLRDQISITAGRGDEGAQVDAGKCSLTFNNRDGRYSPRNPLSPYFGVLGRNTPIRVSAGTGAGAPVLYLPPDSDGFASTPDTAVLDVTGDVDVRVDVAAEWGRDSGGMVGKYVEPGNQRSWILWLNEDRTVTFFWSSTGANLLSATSAVLPVTEGRLAVRATLDADNGAAGRTITFYTAETLAGPWTQLGSPIVQAGATSIFSSTSDLVVGRTLGTVSGRYYAAEVRAGIGGTLVADPDFAAQPDGSTGFTDGAGRAWTLGGDAAITTRKLRFTGEVSAWPTRWDVSGKDVFVPVEAAGILRRLGQGRKPLQSALRRAVNGSPARIQAVFGDDEQPIVAYWPIEDAGDANQAAAAVIPGVPPLRAIGPVTFTDEASGGTAGGATFGDGGKLVGTTPPVPTEAWGNGAWLIIFWFDLPADMGTDGIAPIVQWRTPGSPMATHWSLYTGQAINGVLFLEAADDDNMIVLSAGGFTDLRGRGPVQVAIQCADNADTNTSITVTVDGSFDWEINAAVNGDRVSTPTAIGVNLAVAAGTQFSGSVSHLIVAPFVAWQQGLATGLVPAGLGYRGESAGDRFLRLTAEEGVAADLIGTAADTEPMGPQLPAPMLELLREGEAADGGTLHEARDALALRYRTRVADYNALPSLTLDYLAGHIAPPIEPVDDDQYTRNDVTVARTGGSSAQLTREDGPLSTLPPEDGGVGRYDTSLTLNLEDDSRLVAQAGWHLHLGTWDESRYRAVHIDLAAAPELAEAVTSAGLRSMVRLTNLPEWLPPGDVDLFVEGYEETIGVYDWDVVLHCRPAGPWRVGVADDGVLGRADTDGSVLAEAVDAATTAFLVASTDGPYWTTDPAEAGFDAAVGGEVVTVNAVADGVVDGFDRTESGGWGSAPDGQAWTVVGTASRFSVASSEARLTYNATFVADIGALDQHCDPVDVEMAFKSPVSAFTGSGVFVYLVGFYDQAANNWYALVMILNTDGTMGVFFEIKTAGVTGALNGVTIVPGVTVNNTSTYRARLRIRDGLLQGKLWDSALPEPPDWHTTVFDSTHTGGGDVGAQVFIPAGVTNPLPLVFPFPEFVVHNPQKLTVTRSVNGIVKAQTAGADIRLAQPSIIAL